ncbi:Uncharacterised protein [Vibrio cholerae]|nr:Uncharacterised protein [Vibrio cholerae]CSC77423.1 Uncharacterised protein [Vibrio cholerae]CSC87108.1 Uncharacterised protein [Vibrio cholerae]CSI93765.1 Uncharacterised protein [Vibrio cholerae]
MVRFKQTLTGRFIVNVGRQHWEVRPLFLLKQHFKWIIKFVVTQRHSVVTDFAHTFEIRLCIL